MKAVEKNYLVKANQAFMVNDKKTKDTDAGITFIGSEKIILGQNLREEVLIEILKDEMKKGKTCARLNCLRDCKRCNS